MLMQGPSAVVSVGKKRSHHRRALTANEIDGRTHAGVRLRKIAAELAAGFDTVTPVRRAAIQRAALLCVIAEDLAARCLAGFPVSMDELLRAEGCAKRAVADIQAAWPERNGEREPEGWTLK
jgi:hypothetical protein